MKTRNKKLFFWSAFILLCMAFICVLPVYSSMKFIGYPAYGIQKFWRVMYEFWWENKYIRDFSDFIEFRIPVCVMMIVISANALSMKLGFDCYKKKWWYYLMILISFDMASTIAHVYYIGPYYDL